MTEDTSGFFSSLRRAIEGDLSRARDTLVPLAFQVLWEVVRFIVLYGGRSAAKSWSIARVLQVLGHETPLRILCCREIQGSIRESAYRLLSDQIVMLGLDDFYDVQADRIIGKNGTVFYFEGLRYNASKIRSYEGVDIVWVEEAQSVSELSWETLLPTIRKPGSRFFISFNPMTKDDPVLKRFVESERPDAIVRKVSYRDNPHFSPEAEAERAWLEKTDPDAYRHVWEGFPREVSDALILRGKYEVEEFAIQPSWSGPYHGLDYGFSRDPSAGVRCHIDDETRTLYVSREFWALGADIDALPGALETAIPGISRHVVYADAARPESTSYLTRNGIPNARSAEKWPGSVDDGIAYLRAFSRIVIDPSCKHVIDECRSYSFKTDRLTGIPLPEPEDKNNHCIDALRYSLSPLIRNQHSGSYFLRSALLLRGEPVEPPILAGRPDQVYATAAVCERDGSAVGLIYWVSCPYQPHLLTIADFDVVEIEEACTAAWFGRVFARLEELRGEWGALSDVTPVKVEDGQLYAALSSGFKAFILQSPAILADMEKGLRPPIDLQKIPTDKLPPGPLAPRAEAIRTLANAGSLVKLARSAYTRELTHRAVSANHLLSQLLGYRPGADAAQELAAAFVLGCLDGKLHDRRRELPTPAPPPAAVAPEVAAPVPRRPVPGIVLPLGWHEIDGARVLVEADPANPTRPDREVPLSPGGHIINGKIAIVPNPAVGIRVTI